jgi:hypothetical protein
MSRLWCCRYRRRAHQTRTGRFGLTARRPDLPRTLTQRIQHFFQLGGQRRADRNIHLPLRIGEANTVRMQEHALESEAAQLFVEDSIAVFVITHHRMPSPGGMDANLMRAPSEQLHFHQSGKVAEELHRPDLTLRGFAVGIHAYRALTAHTQIGT